MDLEKDLLDIVYEYGTWNNEGKDNMFCISDEDIIINDIISLENVNNKLLLHLIGGQSKYFSSLDTDSKQNIYNEVTLWRDDQQMQMAIENIGEGRDPY